MHYLDCGKEGNVNPGVREDARESGVTDEGESGETREREEELKVRDLVGSRVMIVEKAH